MRLTNLSHWTPVSLDLARPTPQIDWGDMRGIAFSEPFFDETVARWAGSAHPSALKRTDLDALRALDSAPSLDPSVLIFHLSRCGSTLISRLLSTVPGALVVSEAAPINTLLMSDHAALTDETRIETLRLLIRALGRRRLGHERYYVLKLSSWNVRKAAMFRRAFPKAPIVWVQRSPVEVMTSLLAGPAAWMEAQHHPSRASSLFGIDALEAGTLTREAFCARALASMLSAAAGIDDGRVLTVDYAELPDAVWDGIAPLAGIYLEQADIDRMRDEAQYYSKETIRRRFASDVDRKRAASDLICSLAGEIVEPLYRVISERSDRL